MNSEDTKLVSYYDRIGLNHPHRQLIDWTPESSTVLDLGCGRGALGAYLIDRKACHVVGVEKDGESARASVASGLQVIQADVENPGVIDGLSQPFDVIIFADCLEHLADPWSILDRCHGLLSAKGCVMISLPNVVHFSMRLRLLLGQFDYTDHGGLRDKGHLRFFTYHSACRMFADAGHRVVHRSARWRFLKDDRWIPFDRALRQLAVTFPNLLAYQMLFNLTSQRVSAHHAGYQTIGLIAHDQ